MSGENSISKVDIIKEYKSLFIHNLKWISVINLTQSERQTDIWIYVSMIRFSGLNAAVTVRDRAILWPKMKRGLKEIDL